MEPLTLAGRHQNLLLGFGMHLSHARLLSEPHDYDDVRVLLLTWQDVREYDTFRTNTMKEAFEYPNYEVQVAQLPEIAS